MVAPERDLWLVPIEDRRKYQLQLRSSQNRRVAGLVSSPQHSHVLEPVLHAFKGLRRVWTSSQALEKWPTKVAKVADSYLRLTT